MTKYKIEYDRNTCIGAAVCAVLDEANWEMADDGKADLKGGKGFQKDWYILEIDDTKIDFEKLRQAAEGCPVNAIHITNLETGEKLL